MKSSLCKKKSYFSLVLWALAALTCLMAALPALGDVTQTAVVATPAADYSSSAVSVIPVEADNGFRTAQNGLLAQSSSDITLSAFENYFYLITRYGSMTVAKVDINAPDTVIWQYSTEGNETDSNPYQLVFASSEKAYMIRAGSAKIWIVDPSAETEEDFKIGELDLSAYDDGDGLPEMASGVIADGKLFVAMQRLTDYLPTENKPYIAVFDVETDTEIDTLMGEGGLKGIALETKNPMTLQYLAENDTIYVQCPGAYPYGWTFAPEYEDDGGIVAIDIYDYSTTLVLDDGDGLGADLTWGTIAGMEIISSTKGYFVGGYAAGENTLYAFNPSADNPDDPGVIAIDDENIQGKSIAGMESGIYADMNGLLWICNQTDQEVLILDTDTDTVVDSVDTELNPGKVVFTIDSVTTQQGFDHLAYLAANSDLPSSWGKAECMIHYKLYGFTENRAVAFNLEEYLNANPDFPRNWTLAEGLSHYNMYGKFEGRLLAFDAQEYLSLYSDLPQDWTYEEAYAHYVNYGKAEGRIASFDETAYLELYEDLPSSWGQEEAFLHYHYYGQGEGRVYDPYDEDVFVSYY